MSNPADRSYPPIHSDDSRGVPCFKVVVAGDASVGKTQFVHRLFGADFTDAYCPTQGAEVLTKVFQTTSGPIGLTFWDTAGDERLCTQGDGYYIQAQAAILMFDYTNKRSYERLESLLQAVMRTCYPDIIPIVVCGNKHDCKPGDRQLKEEDARMPERHGLPLVSLSVKTHFNTVRPVLYLLRKLTGHSHLQLL